MTASTNTGFFSNEPQVVQGVVLWVLTQVGAILLGHTHLVSSDEWSSLTTLLVPLISAAAIGLVTLVWRNYLSPAWKVVQTDIDKTPYGDEIEKLVEARVESYLRSRFPQINVAVGGGGGTGSFTTGTAYTLGGANGIRQGDVPDDQVDGSPSVGTPAPGEFNGTAQAG